MRHTALLLALVMLVSAPATAQQRQASKEQRATVAKFLAASAECVYDVRDKRMKYESSRNCQSLGPLSLDYLYAPGPQDERPLEVEIQFAQGRLHAWMALALSESGGKNLSIW